MRRKNLAGQTFDYWTVQDQYIVENSSRKWLFACRCGAVKYVNESNLLSGKSKSCGCLKKEAQANVRNTFHHIDGTCIEALKREQHSDNTSEHTGVCKLKSGRYRAIIGFKGRRHNLGTYSTFEEAVKAREYTVDRKRLPCRRKPSSAIFA